jgi:hypothetical protein
MNPAVVDQTANVPDAAKKIVDDCVTAGKKPTTIKRYVATIARVHVAAKLLNPCSSEAVRLGLKKMGRETSARQDQAHPLGWKDIKEFIDSAGEGLRAGSDSKPEIRVEPLPTARR